jgi:hypothetical protein
MREVDLYPSVQDYIELRFKDRCKPTYGELRHISAITATAGGQSSGYWSRPDLALAAVWRTKYGLGWSLDLYGFEVKTQAGCTPAAVHEALSHGTLVHFPYLVWHNPEWGDHRPECRSILERCSRYGVGLITFDDPPNSDSYSVRVDARRQAPTLEAVDEFIETRFADAERQSLLGWVSEVR